MPLQKQNIEINFALGLDTKGDPFQINFGNMLVLQNSVFQAGGMLLKRNGFGELPAVSDATSLTTFKENLIAIGQDSFQVLSRDTDTWLNRGQIKSTDTDVLSAVRTSTDQQSPDVAIASNGLACAVYEDNGGDCFYQIIDSSTGQIIQTLTQLPAGASQPRVYSLGRYFIVTFLIDILTVTHLQYIAIPIQMPSSPNAAVDLSTQVDSITAAYDGAVANNNLYLAYNASDVGGAIRLVFLTSTLVVSNTTVEAGITATMISLCTDTTTSTPTVWLTYGIAAAPTDDVYAASYDFNLNAVLASTLILSTSDTKMALISAAANDVLTVFCYRNPNAPTPGSIEDYITKVTITGAGVVGTPSNIIRSLGFASKAIYYPADDLIYFVGSYGSDFQPTLFLVDEDGNVVSKLAAGGAKDYADSQVFSNITLVDSTLYFAYLLKTLLTGTDKSVDADAAAPIGSQFGTNLAAITLNSNDLHYSDIGNNLHITGGYLRMYDGAKPVEHGFHVYPDPVSATASASAGSMAAQAYFYQVTYEWTDAQGNLHRSAPSVPFSYTLVGPANAIDVTIPMLKLTSKTGNNPVRLVVYRWSTAQQTFYQVTAIDQPIINDPTQDTYVYTDTQDDASILGNLILYTTGGVVENIAAPPCTDSAMFKSRLFLIDAEDENLLWYSKQVIETVPVETSDLFTIYVAPTTAAQGSTGPMRTISAMDDKLIIFKQNSIYYITGNGPDNTGANNDFSEPVFITSTVGCTNKNSVVFMPQGLMFQSDKGIWLLARDLSTSYIGAAVEDFNDATVVAAVNVPGTNQVRFTLDNGVTLMYDYYYGQWGTFVGIPAISSTLYENLHTYLNAQGKIFQETPGRYLDGSNPVLMSFTTGWLNMTGLQGYQRAYFLYLLGQYLSPHKLTISLAYDYNPYPSQTTTVTPDNFSGFYGDDSPYGAGTPYGGNTNVEQWRIFLSKQKCESIQISISETYDPSYGVEAGAGFTMSGINLVFGQKKSYTTIKAANSAG